MITFSSLRCVSMPMTSIHQSNYNKLIVAGKIGKKKTLLGRKAT
uniref:Uncharacterized protein n=1 Tax=Setaria italica TaxID=4555 RepID=K3ZG84_SETIT